MSESGQQLRRGLWPCLAVLAMICAPRVLSLAAAMQPSVGWQATRSLLQGWGSQADAGTASSSPYNNQPPQPSLSSTQSSYGSGYMPASAPSSASPSSTPSYARSPAAYAPSSERSPSPSSTYTPASVTVYPASSPSPTTAAPSPSSLSTAPYQSSNTLAAPASSQPPVTSPATTSPWTSPSSSNAVLPPTYSTSTSNYSVPNPSFSTGPSAQPTNSPTSYNASSPVNATLNRTASPIRPTVASSAPSSSLSDTSSPVSDAGGDGDRGAVSTARCCAPLKRIGFTSTLPVLIMYAPGSTIIKPLPGVPRPEGSVCTCGVPNNGDVSARVTIQLHGSSSARDFVKKPFQFKTQATLANGGSSNGSGSRTSWQAWKDGPLDESGSAAGVDKAANGVSVVPPPDIAFLGMSPDREWMLGADGEVDRTVGMRNALAYDVGRSLGQWAPNTVWCELFVVQDYEPFSLSHYRGLYLGTETIERSPFRVDVAKMKPKADLSGGYILGFEHGKIVSTNAAFFNTTSGLDILMRYPSAPNATEDSENLPLDWIQAYMNQVEDGLLYGMGDWRAVLDQGAFIDYFLGTELTKNPDGYRGSIYMHKDLGGKLMMGPMWDYNEAFGQCCGYPIEGFQIRGNSSGTSGGSGISPNGWRFNICDQPERCLADPEDGISRYYRHAWQESAFRAAVAARWQQLRQQILTDTFFDNQIASHVAATHVAAMRNYARWTTVLARFTANFTNYKEGWLFMVRQLASWTLNRVSWMDAALADAAAGGLGQAPAWTPVVGPAGVLLVGPPGPARTALPALEAVIATVP